MVVSADDVPIGGASKKNVWKNGDFHRIVRIMVEDNQGRVLIQKRLASMILYPNCWDNSAAGHVDVGETYETAAKRELFEEIGLDNVALEEVGYYQTHNVYQNRQLNRFVKAYKVIVKPNSGFIIQENEVASVEWLTVDEIKSFISNHPDEVTDGLVEVIERFY